MTIERTVKIAELPEFKVAYSKNHFEKTDTDVTYYETEKISILLTDGLSAVVGDRVISSGRGDALFFGRDELHFARLTRCAEQEYVDFFLTADFVKALGTDTLAAFLTDRSEGRINRCSNAQTRGEFLEIARIVKEELLASSENSNFTVFSALTRLVSLIAKHYEEEKSRICEDIVPYCVKKALSIISEEYSESISLVRLAGSASCSVAYLSRSFKNAVGISVYRYLTEFRLKKARKLLMEGASVTEVCYAVGFTDTSNFIRTFKEKYGITPYKFSKI